MQLLLIGAVLVLATISQAPAAGAGLLRSAVDAASNAGRRTNIDAPPLERAARLIGTGAGAELKLAVLRAPDGDRYYVVASDGTRYTLRDSVHLLDYLDEITAMERGFVPVFEEVDYFQMRSRLVLRTATTQAQVALTHGESVPIRRVDGPKGPALALEVRENLLLQAAGPNDIKDLNDVLKVSFDVPDTHVLSLFDESDVRLRHSLDGAVGEAHVDLASLTANEILLHLADFNRKIVVVVGHIEDGDFVVRRPDGTVVARVPVREMERIAEKNETSLILIGCDAAGIAEKSSGLTAPVRDFAVAASLKRAMRASDYGGFLSALGTEAAPLLIRAATLRGHRSIMRAERQSDVDAVNRLMQVNVTSVAVAGKWPAAVAERRSRLVPFLPVWMQYLYIGGIGIALLLVRTLWREWVSAFPILDTRSEWQTKMKRVARYAGFALTAPGVGAVVLAALPVAFALFFLPFVPWSAPPQFLAWLEVFPYRTIRMARHAILPNQGTLQR